jgi:hypothetical protein
MIFVVMDRFGLELVTPFNKGSQENQYHTACRQKRSAKDLGFFQDYAQKKGAMGQL